MVAEARVKILVIDDELGPRESLRMLLKKEFDVICAESVDEGVEELRHSPLDLVIMDIRMPGKSGIEGLGEIRKIDKLVSVVMLTGYGSLETAQQALRLGANDYLNKPFDTKEMQATVTRYAERTRLERKRARMLNELHEMNTRLINDLADKERMAQLGQGSAELVHDLRNPLTIVSGYVDLLSQEIERTKAMEGQANDYLEVIEQNVRRCCDLAQMWQRFSREGANVNERLRIEPLLEDVSASVIPLASTAQVDIVFHRNEGQGVIYGNRPQLIRAVHNVVSNAIQACAPGEGRVEVSCRADDRDVCIVVRDNGCGMPADVRDRIFEPYFTTKTETDGTGLGMVITRKVVDEHKGALAIESQAGEGTTVRIRLPLAREPADAVLV